jgi:hypothetical protein
MHKLRFSIKFRIFKKKKFLGLDLPRGCGGQNSDIWIECWLKIID